MQGVKPEVSAVTIDDIRNELRLYEVPGVPKFEDAILREVIRDSVAVFKVPEIFPIHLNDIPHLQLKDWNSSSGLPWKKLGFKTKKEVAHDKHSFQSIRRMWHFIKDGESISLPDCMAYIQQHLISENEQTFRINWGYSASVSFMEACFALPLIDAYKKSSSPIAYGLETAKSGRRRIIHRIAKHNNCVLLEFSHFDTTVPDWLIRYAFYILTLNINLTRYKDGGVPDTRKLYRAWEEIVTYFINTPIRMWNGERYRMAKGITNGSYFTQLVSSIVSWIVTQYSFRKLGVKIIDHLVLGDKSFVATNFKVDIFKMSRYVQKFGMTINIDKTQQASKIQKVDFLQYFNITGGSSASQVTTHA